MLNVSIQIFVRFGGKKIEWDQIGFFKGKISLNNIFHSNPPGRSSRNGPNIFILQPK